jgi:molybdopterin converting factor subunit 1
MKVTVRLFAAARERCGSDQVELTVAEPATVGSLRRELAQRFPCLEQVVAHSVFAVDQEYADEEQLLGAESVVACIPPVSGG